jgi:sigma-B regulation protein RsbU (phosphoserine phosphatase)
MGRKRVKPPKPPKPVKPPQEAWSDRFGSFVREYTAGVSSRNFQRLFDRDAAQAWTVLTREHAGTGPEDTSWLHRIKVGFLGLSYKLAPERRVLFVAALALVVLGMFNSNRVTIGRKLVISFSPPWFLLSLAILIFLLALELVDKVRVRDELEVARELQIALLPHVAPLVPGYRFVHSYRTAHEVGGDYYDFTLLPDGRLALMVGDASGHGMAAGLVMAIANATLETALDLDPSPLRVLPLLNRTLCRTGSRRNYMSLFYGLLQPETGHLEYVCAGHPFPLLLRKSGEVEELGSGSLPLGLRDPVEPATGEAVLEPGDFLVLYTDGLVEAMNPAQTEAFGYDRLRQLAGSGGSVESVYDRILFAFDSHVGEEKLLDDLTLAVIGRLPPLPA